MGLGRLAWKKECMENLSMRYSERVYIPNGESRRTYHCVASFALHFLTLAAQAKRPSLG